MNEYVKQAAADTGAVYLDVASCFKDENGELIEPVFLTHCMSFDMRDEMIVNLLNAYDIPCVRQYPADGDFGRLIIGMSGQGVDIYVPKTMYEDAVNLTEGSAVYEEL